MPINVAPGATVDISTSMVAPALAGRYQGVWQLKSADGKMFGVGASAAANIWVRIRVIAPAYVTATPTKTAATATPASSATATLTVSETPAAPSATAAPEVRYDFAANPCAAQWQSNTGVLKCPGTDGDASGFILGLSSAHLEDGSTTSLPTLLTFPANAADGYILGVYPDYVVQAGDHFQASVGCEQNATTCSVLFRLSYLDEASALHDLWTLGEFYDGKYFNLDLDLSRLAGQRVKFVLNVSSLGSATGDRALWVAPRIMHFPVEEATATGSPIAPTATSTPVPSATVIARPTPMPTALPAPTAVPAAPSSTPTTLEQVWQSILSFFQQLFGTK
jgi:hypothetical protein